MIFLINIAAVGLALAALALTAFVTLEVVFSLLGARNRAGSGNRPDRIAVIVPAHNETSVIDRSLASFKMQLTDNDQLIVVADNCTDNTAQIARAAGADVLERNNADRRGKGFALQHALDHLKSSPPDVVIFLDADCILGGDVLRRIADLAVTHQRPVQATYLLTATKAASVTTRISAFAWMFMNKVRMRGLDRLSDTSRITGSGFALPWPIAKNINVASGEVVEDLALTFSMTEKGSAPIFASDVFVYSEVPDDVEERIRQSARWEHGSQALARKLVSSSLWHAVVSRNFSLFALAVDLAVPPMVRLAMLVLVANTIAVLTFFVTGAFAPLGLSLLAAILMGMNVLAAWAVYGRDILSFSDLFMIDGFFRLKRRVYGADAKRSARVWSPTRERSGVHDEHNE